MVEQDEWVFFEQIEWSDKDNNRFNVDTRDFHVGYNFTKDQHKDWNTIKDYDHFFFTEEELKKLITRLYTESGGKGKWRMITLISNDARVLNWNLKYLRIWRTEKGFIVCNAQNAAVPKNILSCKIDLEYLAHH